MRLVFDVESNGLDGPAFAVGWVVTDHGKVVKEGFLRCPIEGAVDPWVLDNVIPKLKLSGLKLYRLVARFNNGSH